jgi:hypothetical protein
VLEKPDSFTRLFRLQLSIERPPIPHEHGAWVILYAPAIITLAITRLFLPLPSLLLIVAVTGIFLARHAAGLVIRRRAKGGTGFWLGVYLVAVAVSVSTLLLIYQRYALLQVGMAVLSLFVAHTMLSVWPSRRRLDRSVLGEILAVGALAMTAPAAYAVVHGVINNQAWHIWAACVLYFSSSVFYVKMLLSAGKVKGNLGWHQRWSLGRDNVIYHLLLLLIVLAAAPQIGGWRGLLILVAYAPILLRAFIGWAKLSHRLPPLKRVGFAETFYSLWFAGFFIAAFYVRL